tara:strand:+ start:3885 stop:4406 length:522 start_codon:yes stop_codon:yes gene_type:complete
MKFKKFFYKKINSTNDIAIKKIEKKIKAGIIISEEQKKGRGRHGNKWISLKGNLFTTIFFKINNKIPLNIISKINCRILKKVLTLEVGNKVDIKEPNDLYINKKKICGILQEIKFINEDKYIIIGIGINLVKNPIIKNYPVSNILYETGKKISIPKLLKLIEKNYKIKLKQFA